MQRDPLVTAWRVVRLLAAGALFLAALAMPLAAQTPLDQVARLIEEGRYQEAKTRIDEVVRREPANPRAAFLAGQVRLSLGETDQAVRELERATKLDAESPLYHLWLGRAYSVQLGQAGALRQRGIATRMRDAFALAVQLDPQNIDARMHLIEFHVRAPALVGGDRATALRLAQEVTRIQPYIGHSAQAHAYTALHDTAGIERVLISAHAMYPDSAWPRLSLATLYQDVGRTEESYELLAPVTAGPHRINGAVYLVGRLGAVSGRDLDRSERALREYLTFTPGPGEPPHAAAHTRLGDIFRHRGDDDGARREYQTALRLDPKFQPALEALRKLR